MAAPAPRVIIVHEGGTPWWVPLLIGLAVATIAALASYSAAWWLKKRDVDRESAFRAVDLVDEAEQAASSRERFEAAGGTNGVLHLLQKARVRAQPLGSNDLDDRFRAALDYVMTFGLWPDHQAEPVGGWRWVGEAVANVREGLVPFLSAPGFLPFHSRTTLPRSFPTAAELQAMPTGVDGQELVVALNDWKAQHGGEAAAP